MNCKHRKNVLCEYLTEHRDENGFYVSDVYCEKICNSGKNKKKIANKMPPIPIQLKNAAKATGHDEREKQIEAAVKELPSYFQMAKNLERHVIEIAKHYKATGQMYITDEAEEIRLDKCRNCPDDKMLIKDGVMRCTVKSCGCYLDNPNNRKVLDGKAKYEALDCDNGHWPKKTPVG